MQIAEKALKTPAVGWITKSGPFAEDTWTPDPTGTLLLAIRDFATAVGEGVGAAAIVASKNTFETLILTGSRVRAGAAVDLPVSKLNAALSFGQVTLEPLTLASESAVESVGQVARKAVNRVVVERWTKIRLEPEVKSFAEPTLIELLEPRFNSDACAGRPTNAAADSASAPVTKALRSISMSDKTAHVAKHSAPKLRLSCPGLQVLWRDSKSSRHA